METVGRVGGAEVLVDLEGHRPVVVVRGRSFSGVGSCLAGVLSGTGWGGMGALAYAEGVYEFRIPWDEGVQGVVEQLVDVMMWLGEGCEGND